jgi:hypothetical protein
VRGRGRLTPALRRQQVGRSGLAFAVPGVHQELTCGPKEDHGRIEVGSGDAWSGDTNHVDVEAEAAIAAVRRYYAPNAMDNFCFEVTLGYRRLERPRRPGKSEE